MSYVRQKNGPVMPGDVVREGTVRGFAYVPGRRPGATNDRLLLAGDEKLAEPPPRAVPESAADVSRTAPLPPLRLPADRIRKATEIDTGLPDLISGMLSLTGAAWNPVAGPLSKRLNELGHLMWITGGAARDPLGGGTGAKVNDLDLTGTAPAGRFTEAARAVRMRCGLAECREKVSANSLVCSAVAPNGKHRLYEYRPLKLNGFRFPASGGDMAEDACGRDFTINSLYYDPERHFVIDPTGRGLADLTATPRRLVSVNQSVDAIEQAHIIIRGIKFIVRWNGTVSVETGELRNHLLTMPGEWSKRIDETDWLRLIDSYRRGMSGAATEHQLEAARSLGMTSVELFEELRARMR